MDDFEAVCQRNGQDVLKVDVSDDELWFEINTYSLQLSDGDAKRLHDWLGKYFAELPASPCP